MTVTYDQYYQKENLFGQPYPELIEFLSNYPGKGRVLDLGCGQGRDAIALARLGYAVTGLDHSKVGIMQMNRIAKDEKLNLTAWWRIFILLTIIMNLILSFSTACCISQKRKGKVTWHRASSPSRGGRKDRRVFITKCEERDNWNPG